MKNIHWSEQPKCKIVPVNVDLFWNLCSAATLIFIIISNQHEIVKIFELKKRTNSESILFGVIVCSFLNMVLHFTIQPTKIHGGKIRPFIVVVWDGLGAPLRIDTTGWISGPKHSNNIKISVHRQHSRMYARNVKKNINLEK